MLFVGCLTSQQHASVSQGRICSDNFTCCHTEMEVADQTFHLTQSQYSDTGPTSPSTHVITPGAWQPKPLECQFLSLWYVSTPDRSRRKRDSNLGPSALEADTLTTRPMRRFKVRERHRRPGTAGVEKLVRWLLACLLACLLNVPATCECISGTDLLRQFYVLPH